MKIDNDKGSDLQPEMLTQQVNNLTDEIKLQSINLAVMIARTKQKNPDLGALDSEFGELISKINITSSKIKDILKAFQGRKKMIYSLPASSETIAKRGAYDEIEGALGHIYDLSQGLVETINSMKRRQPLNR
ncbi:MAG: hypothetical protein GY841_12180 [FCB group bacterium]|nr:hypothetical protein [FCB group bacterium]